MTIKITNKSGNMLPKYETSGSAGMDLRAYLPNGPITIQPGDITLVSTGLSIELPVGYEAQVRPRSGLALKHGISCINSPGTIDSDYRGDIGIALVNHGKEPFVVRNNDRIAQMVICRYETVNWCAVSELNDTLRGDGGFGHTGK